jgi:hypothetical protein
MQTVVVLAFILATVFVATESESPPEIPFPYEGCYQGLQDCRSPIHRQSVLFGIARVPELFFQNPNQACTVFQEIADCLSPILDSCDDQTKELSNRIISVVNFLCSEEGRSLINEFQDSECANDVTQILSFQKHSGNCIAEAEAAAGVPRYSSGTFQCQVISDIIDCTLDNVVDQCGSAAGQIFGKIFGIASTLITQGQCSIDRARDLAKRLFSPAFAELDY